MLHGETLCENMNSFFHIASKDSHDLEVIFPMTSLLLHSTSILFLSLTMVTHYVLLIFRLFPSPQVGSDGAVLRNEWCAK